MICAIRDRATDSNSILPCCRLQLRNKQTNRRLDPSPALTGHLRVIMMPPSLENLKTVGPDTPCWPVSGQNTLFPAAGRLPAIFPFLLVSSSASIVCHSTSSWLWCPSHPSAVTSCELGTMAHSRASLWSCRTSPPLGLSPTPTRRRPNLNIMACPVPAGGDASRGEGDLVFSQAGLKRVVTTAVVEATIRNVVSGRT